MVNYYIHVTTLDHVSKRKGFKTLKAARKFAERWVGKHPEIGSYYAISAHGDAKVTVSGASIEELFAEEKAVPKECYCEALYNEETGASATCDYCRLPSTIAKAKVWRAREDAREAKKRRAAEVKDERMHDKLVKAGKGDQCGCSKCIPF